MLADLEQVNSLLEDGAAFRGVGVVPASEVRGEVGAESAAAALWVCDQQNRYQFCDRIHRTLDRIHPVLARPRVGALLVLSRGITFHCAASPNRAVVTSSPRQIVLTTVLVRDELHGAQVQFGGSRTSKNVQAQRASENPKKLRATYLRAFLRRRCQKADERDDVSASVVIERPTGGDEVGEPFHAVGLRDEVIVELYEAAP